MPLDLDLPKKFFFVSNNSLFLFFFSKKKNDLIFFLEKRIFLSNESFVQKKTKMVFKQTSFTLIKMLIFSKLFI